MNKIPAKKLFIFALLLIFTNSFHNYSVAGDCANVHKKCRNPNKDYKISSYSRSFKMRQGKKTIIVLNAYGGRIYYFSTFAKSNVGNLQFRIINQSNSKILYDNSTEGLIDYKLFRVESTKKIIIEIMAPNWRSNDRFECAGFKVAHKNI